MPVGDEVGECDRYSDADDGNGGEDALGMGNRPLVTGTIGRLDRFLVKVWPTMFAYQFVYELSPWRGGALRNDPGSAAQHGR